MRQLAHQVFDALWKSGQMSRVEAYAWLSQQLNVSEAHIGNLDIAGCHRVIEVVSRRKG